MLGRLDFEFAGYKRKNLAKSHTVVVGQKQWNKKFFFNILFDIRCPAKDFIPLKTRRKIIRRNHGTNYS